MRTTQFASVNKTSLYAAVGFARNSKVIHLHSCIKCPKYQELVKKAELLNCTIEELIDECHCSEKEVSYQNERNRYQTDKEVLNAGSLLLYMYLHFCCPNGNGVISSVTVKELADTLHMDHKTILSGLSNLSEKKYINYAKTSERGTYSVVLLSYADSFKSAKEGGRGYSVISKETFEAFLSLKKQLNLLRLDLRVYMETDQNEVIRKTMKQLQAELPAYLRPYQIHEAVMKKRALFDVSKQNSYRFVLNEKLNGKKQKEIEKENALLSLDIFFKELNKYILEKQNGASITSIPETYIPAVVSLIKENRLHEIPVTEKDLEDLSLMSVQYSYSFVRTALSQLLHTADPPYGKLVRLYIENQAA